MDYGAPLVRATCEDDECAEAEARGCYVRYGGMGRDENNLAGGAPLNTQKCAGRASCAGTQAKPCEMLARSTAAPAAAAAPVGRQQRKQREGGRGDERDGDWVREEAARALRSGAR